MRWVIVGTIGMALATVQAPMAAAETISWTQYAADGLQARTITDQKECPAATIDGVVTPMQSRAAPSEAFPNTVCSLRIPPDSKNLKILDVALQVAAAAPKRIAVVGDTGCRLKGIYIQACNDPEKWPFRQVAAAIATKQPDLIIHVGDYHYRETACPTGDAGCANSSFGDNWAAWRDDFFAPASSLLAAAPWVMVRGNHEECSRGGHGWSRALEAAPFDDKTSCNASQPPFVVQLAQMALAVVDTAAAPEPTADEGPASNFRAQYQSLAKLASGPIWLLQHRPIWSTGGVVAGLPFGDNKTLAKAARDSLPPQVQLTLSGHHHIFQVLSYNEDLPTQIVSGHGGDTLNKGRTADPAGWSINGVSVKTGIHHTGAFGFAMLESHAAGWVVTNYSPSGVALQHCDLVGRSATCFNDR